MATSINTTIESICLSAHLPEELSIETDAAQLQVNIFVDTKKVFTSVYYPYSQEVCVRDIRSIIEAAMEESKAVMSSLKITVFEPEKPLSPTSVTYDEDGNIHVEFGPKDTSPAAQLKDIKVVYSRFKTSVGSSSFLSWYFLSTRTSALLPHNGQLKLSNYTRAMAQGSNEALIYYVQPSVPGEVMTYRLVMGKMQSSTERIVSTVLSYDYFKGIVDRAEYVNCRVLGVEYQIGSRQFNIFFTDEEPTDVFKFLSAFNIMETAYLFNTTTVKTEVDRSEAVCGHETQFYDETIKTKYEVETAPLTYDEAQWLNQMLTSKLVMKPVDNYTSVPILISDISSEVSDSDKELIRLKFSWKYADGKDWM